MKNQFNGFFTSWPSLTLTSVFPKRHIFFHHTTFRKNDLNYLWRLEKFFFRVCLVKCAWLRNVNRNPIKFAFFLSSLCMHEKNMESMLLFWNIDNVKSFWNEQLKRIKLHQREGAASWSLHMTAFARCWRTRNVNSWPETGQKGFFE